MLVYDGNPQQWSVSFYVDARGESPVAGYLAGLAPRDRAKIARYLKLLQEFGPALAMPQARQIEGRLWELRPDPYRVFYAILSEHRCIVLHAYRKQGQKAPRWEIERALRRLMEWTSRPRGEHK